MDIIVIINGMGGSGKSTFCKKCNKYFIEKTNENSLGIELSTIDFVKTVAEFCGWRGKKEAKDREFLHNLKVALEEWNDVPNKKTQKSIEEFMRIPYKNRMFFVNIREIKNIEAFKNWAIKDGRFKVATVFVNNKNVISNEPDNVTKEMTEYDYDYIINNDGTLKELDNKVIDFINNLIKGE